MAAIFDDRVLSSPPYQQHPHQEVFLRCGTGIGASPSTPVGFQTPSGQAGGVLQFEELQSEPDYESERTPTVGHRGLYEDHNRPRLGNPRYTRIT